jgi:hypothetical protein
MGARRSVRHAGRSSASAQRPFHSPAAWPPSGRRRPRLPATTPSHPCSFIAVRRCPPRKRNLGCRGPNSARPERSHPPEKIKPGRWFLRLEANVRCRRNRVPIRTSVLEQLPLVPQIVGHQHVQELREMSRILDANPQARSWCSPTSSRAGSLRPRGVRSSRRAIPPTRCSQRI